MAEALAELEAPPLQRIKTLTDDSLNVAQSVTHVSGRRWEAPSATATACWLLALRRCHFYSCSDSRTVPFQLNPRELLGFRGQHARFENLLPSICRVSELKKQANQNACLWFHEAGLVLEEYLMLNNSVAADPSRHRVISVLRSGDSFHYGPQNCRYFHVDFRNDDTYACNLAILYNIIQFPWEEEVWPEDTSYNWLRLNVPSVHRAIEYVDAVSSDQDVRFLGYNTLAAALNGSVQAAVVLEQLADRMPDWTDEDLRMRVEKIALSYHHGTESQRQLLQPIFEIGLYGALRSQGDLSGARAIAERIGCLQVRALLVAAVIEDYHARKAGAKHKPSA